MNERDVKGPLIEAMMVLEMALQPETYQYPDDEMKCAEHSLVQLAWQRACGVEEQKLPESTCQLLAKIHADSAIVNAQQKEFRA